MVDVNRLITVLGAFGSVPWADIAARAAAGKTTGQDVQVVVDDALYAVSIAWPPAAGIDMAFDLFIMLEEAGLIHVTPATGQNIDPLSRGGRRG